MQNPRHLRVYQAAQRLAKEVRLVSYRLPPCEHMALGDQMRRAAVSVGSNIAEGCGRSTPRDFRRCLHIALGSAEEVEFQLDSTLQSGQLSRAEMGTAMALCIVTERMLRSLIQRLRSDELRPPAPN
jgi:four helix bundle protein